MTTGERLSQGSTGRLEALTDHRGKLAGTLRTSILVMGLFALPLLVFSLIQYARYGFGLFLGWDTSTYVWWAKLVYLNGPLAPVFQGYPNLYVLALAAFGALLGSASLAERVFPILVTVPLAWAYYHLAIELTFDRKLGYLVALVGGLSVNTLRLYSDLHRNLLSFGVSMLVGTLISSQGSSGPVLSSQHRKQVLLLVLPMLAAVAYTQIETYTVLAVSLVLFFLLTQGAKGAVLGGLLLATPVLVALPLIWPFVTSYQGQLALIGLPTPSPPVVLGDSLLYLGGLAIPWTVIGLIDVVRQARLGRPAAMFVALWLLALVLLLPVGLLLGFPYDRFLYVVPIPVLVAAGVASTLRHRSSSSRRRLFGLFGPLQIRTKLLGRSIVVPSAVAILLTMTLLTSVTADIFLRSYVGQAEVNRITEAAEIIRQLGYSRPILVIYGPTAADVNPIYRAYFGIEIPDSFAYYGKLQYVFTLPEPGRAYQWQYDPSFEQATSLRYRSEILSQLGSASAVSSRPIVIAGGKTYDRPLSETFLSSEFERLPGIYIIPPNQLTPKEIDSWRLYAYSDWDSVTQASIVDATWSQSGKILNWAERTPKTNFEANYTISLAKSWANMTMTLGYYDWPQSYVFPDTTSATLAPLEVYFDGKLIGQHSYSGLGPLFLSFQLVNVTSGIHRITVESGSGGSAIAVGLDYLKLCPAPC